MTKTTTTADLACHALIEDARVRAAGLLKLLQNAAQSSDPAFIVGTLTGLGHATRSLADDLDAAERAGRRAMEG